MYRRCGAAALLALAMAVLPRLAAADAGGPASIRFETDPESPRYGQVSVVGLDHRTLTRLAEAEMSQEAWQRILLVRTAGGSVPMLGRYGLEAGAVLFAPRFPPSSGLTYRARFDPAALAEVTGRPLGESAIVEAEFTAALAPENRSTTVERVEPGARIWPENLLRIYVHFSAPMREHDAQQFVKLLDQEGREVPDAFVEIEPGLWDPGATRLTMFLHPGRIKRGVEPNRTMGPPLREGERYRLVIQQEMRDARGFQLAKGFEREVLVGSPDRTSPSPASWTLQPPIDPQGPIVVTTPEPLDHALALRLLGVETSRGRVVAGTASLSEDGRRWRFQPHQPWVPGDYRVVVDPALEDLAGNRPGELFDVEGGYDRSDQPVTRLDFRVESNRSASG